MQNATPRRAKARKTPSDYNANVLRFYAAPWVGEGLRKLALLNKVEGRKHDTISALIVSQAKRTLRDNVDRLREAGHELPTELFTK